MLESVLRVIYPPTCLACDTPVAEPGGLCGPCRAGLDLALDPACAKCGLPLPGQPSSADPQALCDACLVLDRPWRAGRTAFVYDGTARRLILALKHGDRTDLARPLGRWMARAAAPMLAPGTVIVPIPLHWRRRVRRRYNQSALLATALAREIDAPAALDALVRTGATRSLDGLGRAERFETLRGRIAVAPGRAGGLAGRPVCLVDDVMTSGATFDAAARAVLAAGAREVCVVSLARVPLSA